MNTVVFKLANDLVKCIIHTASHIIESIENVNVSNDTHSIDNASVSCLGPLLETWFLAWLVVNITVNKLDI